MYADCVASTSRLELEDWTESLARRWQFETSDCRSEERAQDTHPRRAPTSLQAPSKPSATVVHLAATTTFSTAVPLRTPVSPGVFSDGRRFLFSSAHPDVQTLLETARSSLALPKASSDVIFTLAALEVFYKPTDPVHWLFWSDDKKNATADVVTRIALHKPPLIISRVAWIGKLEYLCILATHHGHAWRPLYEKQPWFSIVVPPKVSTPPRQLNLRKRKVAAGALKEPSPGFEDIDEDDLLPGPGNDSRAPSSQPMNDNDTPAPPLPKKRPQRTRAAKTKLKAPTLSPLPPSLPPSPVTSALTLSPEEISTEVDGVASGVPATRSKRKVSPPSRYPQSTPSGPEGLHGLLHPILEASLLLGPAMNPAELPSMAHLPGPGVPGHGTHSRTRSTSTDFSGKTAVGSGSSRSASVASGASTAVGAPSPSKKRKAIEVEGVDLLEGDAAVQAQGDEDAEAVSVASGRTKRSRKVNTVSSSVDDAVALEEKSKVAKPTAAPRATRKKARKA